MTLVSCLVLVGMYAVEQWWFAIDFAIVPCLSAFGPPLQRVFAAGESCWHPRIVLPESGLERTSATYCYCRLRLVVTLSSNTSNLATMLTEVTGLAVTVGAYGLNHLEMERAAEGAGAAEAGGGWADLEQPLTGTEPAAAIARTAESSISISFKFSIVHRGRSV